MSSYFSLIEWPKPFFELYYFVGLFAALGAIGFRYTSLRGRLGTSDVFERMVRMAAVIGAIGAALILLHIFEGLPGAAARDKTSVETILTTLNLRATWFYLTLLAVAGFVVAATGKCVGWPLAAGGVLIGMLRYLFVGDWARLIVPMHIITGGLWIGTLAVLVGVGMGVLFKHPDRAARGTIAADMVNAFSPLALTGGALVVIFGVLATLREFKPLSNIWTTPFGYTLIVKVLVVVVVFTLGAWNWRKQRPSLGTDDAARKIRQSAVYELMAAMLVLILTSVMVSLPDPH